MNPSWNAFVHCPLKDAKNLELLQEGIALFATLYLILSSIDLHSDFFHLPWNDVRMAIKIPQRKEGRKEGRKKERKEERKKERKKERFFRIWGGSEKQFAVKKII